MSVADLLQTINNSRLKSPLNPVNFKTQNTIRRSVLGAPPVGKIPQSPVDNFTPGQTVQQVLQNSKNNAQNIYDNYREGISTDLAQRILNQSAGTRTDKYGIVQQPPSNYQNIAKANVNTIGQIGQTALQGAQEQAQIQQFKKLQNLQKYNVSPIFGASYDPSNLPAGSTAKNPGAQAVAIALTAYKNHTPYVWGGNSLTNGVDCSGLVQQAYAKLGVKLPRTTYEQAKSGQIIRGIQNALPGDLIFYNTGSSDPNGIGHNSHVALYLGNGMVLEAYNSRVGIREAKYNTSGAVSTIVRPWS